MFEITMHFLPENQSRLRFFGMGADPQDQLQCVFQVFASDELPQPAINIFLPKDSAEMLSEKGRTNLRLSRHFLLDFENLRSLQAGEDGDYYTAKSVRISRAESLNDVVVTGFLGQKGRFNKFSAFLAEDDASRGLIKGETISLLLPARRTMSMSAEFNKANEHTRTIKLIKGLQEEPGEIRKFWQREP